MSDAIRYHPLLGRSARSGTWSELAVATFREAARALREGRLQAAEALGRCTVDEGREAHELYPVFVQQARRFLLREGIPGPLLVEEEARILENLRMPDGSAFDFQRGWGGFVALVDDFARACRQQRADEAERLLRHARETWRQAHDRACDWVYGLVDVCARRLGEDRVVDLWDEMMAPMYPSRKRYDVDRTPWSESLEVLMLDTAETFRGHLSGPERMGDLEVFEEPDRWVFRFDPCGTGGRTYRQDAEGGPPRMLPPYNYAVTTRPHDWSWGKRGVCLYCVHCCQLQERIPMRQLGYPLRVVDPPTWPQARAGGKCTWYVYKDPAQVPEEAYRRVGEEKPARLGSVSRRDAGLADRHPGPGPDDHGRGS
ncbi:MAG TPA: hypothetical protein VFA45_04035 [Actinomycetes bacterium]|nr:hypothetical protein [Actinomycetes bacterium]